MEILKRIPYICVISIGNELLNGETINTNANWIGKKLIENGLMLHRVTTIPDDEDIIIKAIKEKTEISQLVIITGGLGPTTDDKTKLAICKLLNTTLIEHKPTLLHIENLMQSKDKKLNLLNRKQAEIPEKCTPIYNKLGTAPGLSFEYNNCRVFCLPGVPFEMKNLMTEYVLPYCDNSFKKQLITKKTFILCGIGESKVAEMLADTEENLPQGIVLSYLPSIGYIKLHITSYKNQEFSEENYDAFVAVSAEIKSKLKDYIVGNQNVKIYDVFAEFFTKNKKNIAVAESCTGGYLSHLLTSVSGSSAYYKGGVIAYDNTLKENILKVPKEVLLKHGAVSIPVAEIMAKSVCEQFNTDVGIGITGIAGPYGGTDEKPVGMVCIAIYTKQKQFSKTYYFGNYRLVNIERSAITALYNVYLILKNEICI